MKEPKGSWCWNVRCTSNADGKLTLSGTVQSVFAWHTVLSSTRRGSLPSAVTIFSLPMAVPCGQRVRASSTLPAKGTTQLAWISLSRSSARSLGFFSACVQLPLQRKRCIPSRSSSTSWAWRGCHCLLVGISCRMPAGTPRCR